MVRIQCEHIRSKGKFAGTRCPLRAHFRGSDGIFCHQHQQKSILPKKMTVRRKEAYANQPKPVLKRDLKYGDSPLMGFYCGNEYFYLSKVEYNQDEVVHKYSICPPEWVEWVKAPATTDSIYLFMDGKAYYTFNTN